MRGRDFCRNCGLALSQACLSLGFQPLPNAMVKTLHQSLEIAKHPLELRICENCGLGQVGDYFKREDVFPSNYAYQSGISKVWREYAFRRADQLKVELRKRDGVKVFEIASNDGSALLPFIKMGFKTYGIEPASNLARASEDIGINKVYKNFFGLDFAVTHKEELGDIDLIMANNVAAHVPDIHDFFAGVAQLMSSDTILSIENPGLDTIMKSLYLDTIYHEHYSYLSTTAMLKMLEVHELKLLDVHSIPLHGGSKRYVVAKRNSQRRQNLYNLESQLSREKKIGLNDKYRVLSFYERATKFLQEIKAFFESHATEGIVGFGAAAKTTVILNATQANLYFKAVFDSNPLKQGNFVPGTQVKILSPSDIKYFNYNHVVIFPWNIANEFVSWVREYPVKPVKCWKLFPEIIEIES